MNDFLDMLKTSESFRRIIESPTLNKFWAKNKQTLKRIALVAALIILAAGVYINTQDSSSVEIKGADSGEQTETVANEGYIYVDIGGAVENPMLVKLPDGSRVEDAIQAAGGITATADLTNINRADFLKDGDKILIPDAAVASAAPVTDSASAAGGTSTAAAGVVASASGDVTASTDTSGKININTADSTKLQELSGVGPATAQKILDYRTSNGGFSSIEDIKNVSGIGDKTFEKLKDYITV